MERGDLEDGLRARGQEHLVEALARLEGAARAALEAELRGLDWELLEELRGLAASAPGGRAASLEPAPQIVKGADPEADREAGRRGEALLRAGRVAAFTVAGGQGSRLGFPGPKGLFPASPLKGKSLFRLFGERIAALSRRFGRPLPWYLMTSRANDAETRERFEAEDHFGLEPDQVFFLVQDMLPAFDGEGRLLLADEGSLFLSPDGHGGSLGALRRSGALRHMRDRGVEEIFYFQVDNPLVEIADPVFLGYHAEQGAEMSTKAVPKRDAGEKVGVVGLIDGRFGVIEYSDLSDEELQARDEAGRLRFEAGNIAVHAIRRDFVERLTAGRLELPWHVARKTIPALDPRTARPADVEGVKFETFVFDALARCERSVVLSVDRAREFAPIKNAEGEDSPETSRRAQSELHAAWLEERGAAVPRDENGRVRHAIEIAPHRALGPQDLDPREIAGLKIEGDLFLD